MKAGRQGFEPWAEFYSGNRLAGGPNRPLWHLPISFVKVFSAEEVGFEPTLGFPKPVFKTGAFNRSAIPPQSKYSNMDGWLIQALISNN